VLRRPSFDAVRSDVITQGQAIASWIRLEMASAVVIALYYGRPMKDDCEKKRGEVKRTSRYAPKCGLPVIIGGDFDVDGRGCKQFGTRRVRQRWYRHRKDGFAEGKSRQAG
jgi:hypothetical protein